MSISTFKKLGLYLLKESSSNILTPLWVGSSNLQVVRHRRTKHWDPKWRVFRKLKVIKLKLPNFNEKPGDVSEEEVRSRLKERGLVPPRSWNEKPVFISSTGGIFEPYVPPEGDGKVSPISAQGAKQKLEFLEKKTKTMMAIRKIRSYEEDFDTPQFCKKAEDIYIKAHDCLVKKDKEEILHYVTERAYPEIMHNVEYKTIHWKFLKSIELPRIVHARNTDVITKENIFAQLTVRFHTQQTLAVYDRFGRLIHGSEIIAKDVLEYVVFEKHLANEYGTWRIHGKIIPDWLPQRDPSPITYKKLPEIVEDTVDSEVNQNTDISTSRKPSQEETPALA